MITRLHHLPDVWIFVIFIVPLMVVVVAAAFLGNRLNTRLGLVDCDFQTMDAFSAVASAAAVVIAFSLVQVDTTLRSIEDGVTREANAINDLDRVMLRYGDPVLAQLRGELARYARTLIEDEWPKLRDGGRSAEADDLYVEVSRGLRAVEPTTIRQGALFSEALKAIDEVSDQRELRLAATHNGLPSLFWKSVLGVFAILVAIASQTRPTRRIVWSMMAISATLGLLLALVIIIDAPFAGESIVSTEPIERMLSSMAARR